MPSQNYFNIPRLSKRAGLLDTIYRAFEGLTSSIASYEYQINKIIDDSIISDLQDIEKEKRKILKDWVRRNTKVKDQDGKKQIKNKLDSIKKIVGDIIERTNGVIDSCENRLHKFRKPLTQNIKTHPASGSGSIENVSLSIIRSFIQRTRSKDFIDSLSKDPSRQKKIKSEILDPWHDSASPRDAAIKLITLYKQLDIRSRYPEIDRAFNHALSGIWRERMKGEEASAITDSVVSNLQRLLSHTRDFDMNKRSEVSLINSRVIFSSSESIDDAIRTLVKSIDQLRLDNEKWFQVIINKKEIDGLDASALSKEEYLHIANQYNEQLEDLKSRSKKLTNLLSTKIGQVKDSIDLLSQYLNGKMETFPKQNLSDIQEYISKSASILVISSSDIFSKRSSELTDDDKKYIQGLIKRLNSALRSLHDTRDRNQEAYADAYKKSKALGKIINTVPPGDSEEGDEADEENAEGGDSPAVSMNEDTVKYVKGKFNRRLSNLMKYGTRLAKNIGKLSNRLSGVDKDILRNTRIISRPEALQYINTPSFFRKDRMKDLGWNEKNGSKYALSEQGYRDILRDRDAQINSLQQEVVDFVNFIEETRGKLIDGVE